MLTAISGTYENGQVTLAEQPPVQTKANVMVTFWERKNHCLQNRKTVFQEV